MDMGEKRKGGMKSKAAAIIPPFTPSLNYKGFWVCRSNSFTAAKGKIRRPVSLVFLLSLPDL